jgi:hypothetical protein
MDTIGGLFKKGISKGIKSIFSKNKASKNLTTKGDLDLHDVLKNSYDKKSNQANFLKDKGYTFDNELSNDNQQVYYNNNGHLLFSVAGTHNLSDVAVDAKLMLGQLKDTKRYQEAEMTFNKARDKYKPTRTTALGHSLGASISAKLNADEIITLDKGAEPGAKTKNNEKAYRTSGDIVSVFASGGKNVKTLHKGGYNLTDPFSWYKAHNISNIKDFKIGF